MSIKVGNIMSILLVVMCVTGLSAAAPAADFTEGGHLETYFGVKLMAEWWYLNGDARLVASDGEKRDIGFFVIMAHQESPMFVSPYPPYPQLSQLFALYGIYFDNGTTIFNYTEAHVPQAVVGNYIALGTPYVDYTYPDYDLKRFYGSALPGYNLNYISEGIVMDLFFQTNNDKTIDQADQPLNFTTYEHPYGTLHGSIILGGKKYTVTQAEGYMDHMIPVSNSGGTWPMDMHGWTWFEVTTKKYQAVAYAVRSLNDGYDDYSYKHLTLLNKHNGKVLAEYSGDDITITETGWIDEPEYNRKRPSMVTFSTSDPTSDPDLNITLDAENVIYFNQSKLDHIGFVDFMAFQPDGATIQYNGNSEEGSAFYEYLVSDMGVIYSNS